MVYEVGQGEPPLSRKDTAMHHDTPMPCPRPGRTMLHRPRAGSRGVVLIQAAPVERWAVVRFCDGAMSYLRCGSAVYATEGLALLALIGLRADIAARAPLPLD